MKAEHMWHRDKALSRAITSELRALWCDFDPIGIKDFDSSEIDLTDEYDDYLGWTLTCLKSDDPVGELNRFLRESVEVRMGMDGFLSEEDYQAFTRTLIRWFKTVEARVLALADSYNSD